MLNKNQSKKWNTLKYALVIPVLIAFVFLFQMEVIAKEKPQKQKIEQSSSNDVDVYKINKNTTEAELKEKAQILSEKYDIKTIFSKVKRNSNNELIGIKIKLQKGKEIATEMEVNSKEPIKDFAIAISKNDNGTTNIGIVTEDHKSDDKIAETKRIISTNHSIPADTQIIIDDKKADKEEMEKLAPEEIRDVVVINNSDKKEIRIITKKHIKTDSGDEYIVNGEKVDKDTFNQTDSNVITKMDVTTDGKNTIRVITKNDFDFQFDKDAPVPPTPPAPPVLKFKAPAPPAMPKAPKAPKGDPVHGDKKAWKEFEKQMEEFDAKMKKLEPQMEAFDKQMVDFDKQMEPFNKEMKAFDEKMKVYQKEMEKYMTEKRKNKS